ncbi:phosphoribosylanthranilate isomerase [Paenibacillaceae bacterium]|nr:phosphoribosylanthranilate isomerase [Paenibacillaceae bacterium]
MTITSQTKIKVCGLMDEATIGKLDGMAIDQIGFVFAPSRRQVTAEQAVPLVAAVQRLQCAAGRAPQTVGVFVQPEFVQLQTLLREVPLDIVQLHGAETPQFCRQIKDELQVGVWKVFSVAAGDQQTDGAYAELASYAGAIDAVLIDTAGGGTGQTFDWNLVDGYLAEARKLGVPLYVAGGLSPDNVVRLLDATNPDGVDVSSGVETEGRKDVDKIRLFVERVTGA